MTKICLLLVVAAISAGCREDINSLKTVDPRISPPFAEEMIRSNETNRQDVLAKFSVFSESALLEPVLSYLVGEKSNHEPLLMDWMNSMRDRLNQNAQENESDAIKRLRLIEKDEALLYNSIINVLLKGSKSDDDNIKGKAITSIYEYGPISLTNSNLPVVEAAWLSSKERSKIQNLIAVK